MLNARMVAWDQAKNEIFKVKEDLAQCLDQLHATQVAAGGKPLKIISVEYNYSDSIIHEGRPVIPQAETFSTDFIIENNLPLGIIIKNSCEVTTYQNPGGGAPQVAIADTILMPGDFVGLFEAVDMMTGVRNAPPPHWNVVAGVCSIHAIPNLATQQNRKKLARAFQQHIGDLGFSDASALIDQLKRLPPFHDISQSWRVRILYFSRSWIEALQGSVFSEAKMRVRDALLRQAWINDARVRYKNPVPLQQRLREAVPDSSNHGETVDAAGLLFKRVEDVLAGRHPFYVPLTADSTSGPFGEIAERILSHVTDQICVLSPAYLSGRVKSGYLKLEHLVPAILMSRAEGGIKDRVLEMINVLRLAVQNKARSGARGNELMSCVESLNNIMFQTPGARSGVERGPSIYMVSFDPRRQSAAPRDFSADDFYHPLFATQPNERCAFFRSSIKIDGGKLSEMAS